MNVLGQGRRKLGDKQRDRQIRLNVLTRCSREFTVTRSSGYRLFWLGEEHWGGSRCLWGTGSDPLAVLIEQNIELVINKMLSYRRETALQGAL